MTPKKPMKSPQPRRELRACTMPRPGIRVPSAVQPTMWGKPSPRRFERRGLGFSSRAAAARDADSGAVREVPRARADASPRSGADREVSREWGAGVPAALEVPAAREVPAASAARAARRGEAAAAPAAAAAGPAALPATAAPEACAVAPAAVPAAAPAPAAVPAAAAAPGPAARFASGLRGHLFFTWVEWRGESERRWALACRVAGRGGRVLGAVSRDAADGASDPPAGAGEPCVERRRASGVDEPERVGRPEAWESPRRRGRLDARNEAGVDGSPSGRWSGLPVSFCAKCGLLVGLDRRRRGTRGGRGSAEPDPAGNVRRSTTVQWSKPECTARLCGNSVIPVGAGWTCGRGKARHRRALPRCGRCGPA